MKRFSLLLTLLSLGACEIKPATSTIEGSKVNKTTKTMKKIYYNVSSNNKDFYCPAGAVLLIEANRGLARFCANKVLPTEGKVIQENIQDLKAFT